MTTLKENMPCLPCLLVVDRVRLPSIQHLVSGFTREGHDKTYSACEWHHFGMNHDGMSRQEMVGMLGPSLAHGKRTYQEFFGPEALLCAITSRMIKTFEAEPWIDYNVPEYVRRKAKDYWTRRKR